MYFVSFVYKSLFVLSTFPSLFCRLLFVLSIYLSFFVYFWAFVYFESFCLFCPRLDACTHARLHACTHARMHRPADKTNNIRQFTQGKIKQNKQLCLFCFLFLVCLVFFWLFCFLFLVCFVSCSLFVLSVCVCVCVCVCPRTPRLSKNVKLD